MLSSRNGRSMAGWLAAAVVVGGVLLGVCVAPAARAGLGTEPGAVTLNPASGPTSGKPTWSTSTGCPAGFQGSAVFREVHANGSTTNTISVVVNRAAAPFSGTLQASIARIKAAGGIPNGGTQELAVICFSGPSLEGNSHPAMSTFITYSANGASYTSSGTAPASSGGSPSHGGSPAPSGNGAGSSSSSNSTAPQGNSASSSPASPAPSPSPVNSNLAVTG